MEGVAEGKVGISGDGSRLDSGGGHTIQYTGGLLQDCMPETYVILLTNVTPINSVLQNAGYNPIN